MQVCLAANTLFYPDGGGHVWAYLNWALALRTVGCEVLWMESARQDEGPELARDIDILRGVLAAYGLDEALIVDTAGPLPQSCRARPLEAALDADLLLDLSYLPPVVIRAFRRAALVDIDPGRTQLWWSEGDLELGGYDAYFTVGEGIASGVAPVPDCGVRWRYVPRCVDLDAWPACPPPPAEAAWTTISHWWGRWETVEGHEIDNTKRAAFDPLLDLPRRTSARLELALGGLDSDEEREWLQSHGWQVVDAEQVTSSLDAHRGYVQRSRGEFSAARPLYVSLATGWLSDRTVCYLASGRPAIVEDTGGDLSAGDGLLTFTHAEEAAAALQAVEQRYDHHCQAARQLAEDRYSGRTVATRVLTDALA